MRLLDALRLCLTDVVSIVGGGGKTTLMFRLADEIVAAGGQVKQQAGVSKIVLCTAKRMFSCFQVDDVVWCFLHFKPQEAVDRHPES